MGVLDSMAKRALGTTCLLVLASACSTEPPPEPAGTEGPSSSGSLAEQQAANGWGRDRCPTPADGVASGFAIGEQLEDLTLLDCNDAPIDLRELCGADALWLSIAHAWCPHCRENGAAMEAMHGSLSQGDGTLAAVSILIEGSDLGDAPTASLCSAWREQYAQDRVLTLYDPEEKTWALFEKSVTALNVIVDRDRVIRHKIHTDEQGDIRELITDVLP